ncbi:hypothetical protein TBLA_0E03730 [Henningerozyma blattae CBS 6284]|uniref:Fork-head domain-containing protein n=1 Tax=Henningerozyma blattae (strain ATCC 34711 / CBS 6284 / DSM 70876 / NBRC 10599 / NRRL Y-10934 / UCD 77-7) TaxID=1071380 RepID=I2H4X5_HENB6|nr:hypothetical protein TBLA_0E03730 [Tetrapisispora blattae CBS 6284]CCH61427.1 hypothetical protein TBLA_0E03730 [Tetrapisispora blattae CBS 6284]
MSNIQKTYTPQQHRKLVNAIISVLGTPEQPTTVSRVYSNEKNSATQVQAYAKIGGKDWTYYVKDLEISIGRTTNAESKNNLELHSNNNTTDSSSTSTSNQIDVDLGPAKVVSRKHAVVKFNMQYGGWELHVLGRNGAKVNFKRVTVNSTPYPLSSGTILDIGGTQMMFILPDHEPIIMQNCLDQILPKLVDSYMSITDNPDDDDTLLSDLIKNSVQYKTIIQERDNQLRNLELQSKQNDVKPHQQIRTFKIYNGSNNSNYPNGYNNNSDMGNNGQQPGLVLLSPDLSGSTASFSSNHSVGTAILGPGSSRHDMPSVLATEFPHSVDFSSDLSLPENRSVKPPHSYATMITQAILSTSEGVISLADIYKYISDNYAYYRFAKSGWQNSIRHNLSLNKAFEKVPRKPNEPGKGMKWRINEDYQRDLLKKWNSGKISKVIRRGSSVTRQLQLYMSKYNTLPVQQQEQKLLQKEKDKLNKSNLTDKTTQYQQQNPIQQYSISQQSTQKQPYQPNTNTNIINNNTALPQQNQIIQNNQYHHSNNTLQQSNSLPSAQYQRNSIQNPPHIKQIHSFDGSISKPTHNSNSKENNPIRRLENVPMVATRSSMDLNNHLHTSNSMSNILQNHMPNQPIQQQQQQHATHNYSNSFQHPIQNSNQNSLNQTHFQSISNQNNSSLMPFSNSMSYRQDGLSILTTANNSANTNFNSNSHGNNQYPHPINTSRSMNPILQPPTGIGYLSPTNDSLLGSPTKAFHITAMEAYTPERGSALHNISPNGHHATGSINNENLNVGNKVSDNSNTFSSTDLKGYSVSNGPLLKQDSSASKSNAKSSPNVWNLLQFTSATNTPGNPSRENNGDASLFGPNGATITNESKGIDNEDRSANISSSPLKRQSHNIHNAPNNELILDTESAKISVVHD